MRFWALYIKRMEEIYISTGTVLGMGLSASVNIMLPFVLWMIWRKKAHASWIALFAGIIGYLAAGAVHGVARAIFLTDLQSTPWLFYTMQAIFAGVFEEGGRYLVFRFGIPNRDSYRDAVSYGIGHGGMEHLIVNVGFTRLYGFAAAWLYRVQGMDAFSEGGSGAFLMQGLDDAEVLDILRSISEQTLSHTLPEVVEAFTGMLLHICLSVLVFTAVHYALDLKWLLAAVGLHAGGHLFAALCVSGHISGVEMMVLDCLYTAGVAYLTYRVRENDKSDISTAS